jgi:hypothetical protein
VEDRSYATKLGFSSTSNQYHAFLETLFNNSMELNTSGEAKSCSASEKFPVPVLHGERVPCWKQDTIKANPEPD